MERKRCWQEWFLRRGWSQRVYTWGLENNSNRQSSESENWELPRLIQRFRRWQKWVFDEGRDVAIH